MENWIHANFIISNFLTVTGRLHWIGAAITAVIPILAFLFRWSRRIFPLLKIFGGIKQKPSQFKTKNITNKPQFFNYVHVWKSIKR